MGIDGYTYLARAIIRRAIYDEDYGWFYTEDAEDIFQLAQLDYPDRNRLELKVDGCIAEPPTPDKD